jgi:membrane-associated PAP2 superfamily phosphatase
MLLPGRAAVLMVVTLALAPGLLTNVILKDNWGRSRPFYVTEFGGDDPFLPWWDPRGECPKNCSFVAGEPSGAFWTLAPAAVTPPHWRALAYGGALAFGSAIGLLRMAGGGHFFSDVVFSGVFTFLVIWLVHGWLYRWRATAITDAAVERALEAVVMPVCRSVAWLMARLMARLRGK